MANYSKYLDIEINIDKNKIKLNDIININISIKNTSKYKLENGLFRLNINETIFKLVDKTYEYCINNYGKIGNLKEKFSINISVPVKVVSIPSDLKCKCYCDISFNMLNDNNEIEDLSLRSKIYDFYFESPRICRKNKFIYTDGKKQVCENNIVNPKNINKKDEKLLAEGMKLKNPVDKIIVINKIKPVEMNENNKTGFYRNCIVKNRSTLISTKSNSINKSNIVSKNKNISYAYNPHLLIEDNKSFYKDGMMVKLCGGDKRIDYQLKIVNDGNVAIENVSLEINIPREFSLDSSSLKINNIHYESGAGNKIKLPDLNVFQQVDIEFTCNYAEDKFEDMESVLCFEYNFRDFKERKILKNVDYFKSKIFIILPEMQINKNIFQKDDFIIQEILIKNIGNIPFRNIKLDLNESSYLKDIVDICYINGKQIDKKEILNISFLDIDEEKKVVINYPLEKIKEEELVVDESYVTAQYKIFQEDDYKNIKVKSDKCILKRMNLSLDIEGECSDNILILNEIYTYTFHIINDGNAKINQCQMNILLEENVEYISDSLYIDGKKIESENLTQSINIGEVDIGEEITISYDFKIINLKNEFMTMSCEGLIEANHKSKQIKFKANPLNIENKSLEIIKCISNECVHKGEIIKIQNILNNIGTVNIEDILLKDNKDINLNFVKNSITIDGENVSEINPVDGISINKLNPNENVFICYEYEFNPKKYLTKLVHYSDVYYSYKLGNDETKQQKDRSEKKYIDVEYSIFKQISLENEYFLENTEPDIFQISSVFSKGKIDSFFESYSIKDKCSSENLCDDKKVVIKGTIINRIEYSINNNKSSLYLLERSYPFITVIDIPRDVCIEYIDFKIRCENAFFKVNNKRSFLVSDLILVEGII